MDKNRNRAIRRHHKERMKKKACRVYPWDEQAFKLADNLQFCSCLSCKNERIWCDTRQEYENYLKYIEELKELKYYTNKKKQPRKFDKW